jgi:hypothetical protein
MAGFIDVTFASQPGNGTSQNGLKIREHRTRDHRCETGGSMRKRAAAHLACSTALSLMVLGGTVGMGHAGELYQGRCHMDTCSWFSIEERDLVGTSPYGVLFKVASRDWESIHPNGSYGKRTTRRGGGASTNYVFCSKTKAAVMFPSENQPKSEIVRLAPGNPDAVSGATIYANMYYFAVCHGVDANGEGGFERFGKKFGYAISAGAVESEEIGQPGDLLKP